MNLKERLSSTENLLRAIRSGEAFSSRPEGGQQPTAKGAGGSLWTRRISLGQLFASLGRKNAPAATPEPAADGPNGGAEASRAAPKVPFWARPISFVSRNKSTRLGVSVSGANLCVALLGGSQDAILAARRFAMTPEQAPGEKGFPDFLNACLGELGQAAQGAEIWAVLRSADLDLNVLSVPKLSGGKLDAAVYWTLQKEKKFAEAEYVLDYLVMGPTKDAREPRLDVLTCLARQADVERLREAFREAGRPLAGVTAIPNAFLALYRLPGAPKDHTLAANIHVETDFSAIGLYAQDRLLFSRFIRSGANSMAETLVEHFRELAKPKVPPASPADDLELPLPGAAQQPEALHPAQTQALDSAQAQALLQHVLLGAPRPDFAGPAHLMSPERMLEILTPSIERLARQVERTLDYFAQAQQLRCDAVHLSGDIFGSQPVMQALGAQLGFSPTAFDAVAAVGRGAERVAAQDRMSLAPALAATLSAPEHGINLVRTYKTRTAEDAKRSVTRSLVLGLAGCMLVVGAAGLWIERGNAVKRKDLAQVQAQLRALGPTVDEASLQASVNLFKQRQEGLRQAAARFLPPEVLAELALRLPENAKVLSVTMDMQAPPPAPAPGQPQAPPPASLIQGRDLLVIEGIITGPKKDFDATLSRLIIDMQASPLFSLPVVHQTSLKDLGNEGQVLFFVLHAGVE